MSVTSATPSAIGVGVPERPVLLVERHQRPVGAGAGWAAGVGQQHQAEEPGHLAVVGEQPVELAGEADGLGRQLGPHQLAPDVAV